jgi:hypothetical protein
VIYAKYNWVYKVQSVDSRLVIIAIYGNKSLTRDNPGGWQPDLGWKQEMHVWLYTIKSHLNSQIRSNRCTYQERIITKSSMVVMKS